jgi:hypothetical protein
MRKRLSGLFELGGGKEITYLVVGLMVGLVISQVLSAISTNIAGFFDSLAPEIVGIAFTVIVLNRLDASREHRLIRDKLIREMHSRHNPVTLQAIEELRVLEYLSNGALNGLELRGSNWKDANLYQADLRKADLTNAITENADFYEANLEGAIVDEVQLAWCSTLRGATMPDGSRYDGRYALHHDLDLMQRKGIDAYDAAAVAAWYGVSPEAYTAGQAAGAQARATVAQVKSERKRRTLS